MRKLLVLMVCSILMFSGCGVSNSKEKQTYTSYNDKFTVMVNSGWQEAERGTLNTSADIELADFKNEKFFVALMENKEDFNWTYDEYVNNTIEANSSVYPGINDAEKNDIKIGEYNCKYVELKVTTESSGINTYMQIYYVETENYYGQLLAWTLYSQKDEYRDEFIELVKTFKQK